MAIVGPAFSGASQVSYQYYHAANIAEVSPSATAVASATGTNSSFLRTVADDWSQGLADAQYLVKTKGIKNLTVIGDESFYGAGLAKAVATDAKTLGATVTTKSIANINEVVAVTLERTAHWRRRWLSPLLRASSTVATLRSSAC